MTQCDYLIIGAGSAGCVLANRLSASGRHRVVLLEAGPGDRNPLLRIPILGSGIGLRNPKYDWNYKTAPDPTRNGKQEVWPRGKVLGGSSTINGMIYVRGDPEDFNHWAQLGNTGWGFADVEPLFRKIECHDFEEDLYGHEGPVRIRQVTGSHALSRMFVDANAELGVPANSHYNGDTQEGASILSVTNSGHVRYSSAQAYLQPAKSRQNLKVRTHALARRILLDGKRAIGAEIERQGRTETIFAAKEVVLCGGTINSPQLLMLSGVGPANHMAECGIEVVLDVPGVGENLHEHPAVSLIARSNLPSYNVQLGPLHMLRHAYDWIAKRQGLASTAVFQALSFVKTDPALSLPDIQLHFAPCGFSASDDSVDLLEQSSFTIQANVNRTRSRGYLRLNNASPNSPPMIQPNMFADNYDLTTLGEAARFMFRLIDSETMKPVVDGLISPAERPNTDDEWKDYVRSHSLPTYHPVGTCKMGVDKSAVVAPDLKVHGLEGIRVIDGSVMPQVISGNTQASIMMIAEKGANMILSNE